MQALFLWKQCKVKQHLKKKKKKQYVNTMSAEIAETMLAGVLHFAD